MGKHEYKYEQIEDYILKRIDTGEYKVGGQIPTEFELCDKFKVGRMTVNKAINDLVNKGIVRRISGKGSFVIKKASKSLGSGGGFTQDIARAGMKASSKLLEYRILSNVDEIPDEAKVLMPDENNELIYFVRLRYGDNIPMAISHTYLSGKMFKEFSPEVLKGSLYDYIHQSGLNIDKRENRITAVIANKEQVSLLSLPEGEHTPLIKSTTVRYDKDKPFEYTTTYYVCDNFEYSFSTR